MFLLPQIRYRLSQRFFLFLCLWLSFRLGGNWGRRLWMILVSNIIQWRIHLERMTDLLNLSNGLWEGRIRYGVYWGSILLCSGMTRLAVYLLFVVSTSRVLLLVFRWSISRICRDNQDECNSRRECSFLYNLFEHDLVVRSNPFWQLCQ